VHENGAEDVTKDEDIIKAI